MPAGRQKVKQTATRWWLSGGEEECRCCGLTYAYELEFRCPDCDAPCCPHCRSHGAEGRSVCPDCIECAPAGDLEHG